MKETLRVIVNYTIPFSLMNVQLFFKLTPAIQLDNKVFKWLYIE